MLALRPGTNAMLAGTALRLSRGRTPRKTSLAASLQPTCHFQTTSPFLKAPYRSRRTGNFLEEDEVLRPPTRLEVAEFARNFRQRSQNAKVSIEEAMECLARARKHCEIYSRSQRDSTCRELNLGVTTLNWYQGKYPTHIRHEEVPVGFMNNLCWHLVVQGRQDLIWSWIAQICDEAVRTVLPEEANAYPEAYKWTNRLLGGFIEAQVESSPQRNPTVAIETFDRLLSVLGREGKYYKYVPHVNAGVIIHRRLHALDCPPIEAKLFERFCKSMVTFSDSRESQCTLARLQINHPSRADASEFYRLVIGGSRALSEETFDRIRNQSKRKLADDFLRAAYILRHQGCEDEAQHLEDIVERKVPVIHQRRSAIIERLKRDARLENVRREAALTRSDDQNPEP